MGFAARPNVAILEVREGFQGAFDHVGSGLESVCKEALSSLATLSPPSLWKEGVSEMVRLSFVLIILTSSLSKRLRYSCTMLFKTVGGSQRGKSTGVSAG
jgi:hypothetical protein